MRRAGVVARRGTAVTRRPLARAWLLLALVPAVIALAVLLARQRREVSARIDLPAPRTVAVEPGPQPADFIGTASCASCHIAQFESWARSTHGRAGGAPPATASLVARFDGRPMRFRDATVTPAVRGGRYTFTVAQDGRAPRVFEVNAVIGGGHLEGGGTQGFLSRWEDGTMRFLPFDFVRREGIWFCNTLGRSTRGWLPITPELSLAECVDWAPRRVLGDVEGRLNCSACHGSQIRVTWDTAAKRYETSFASLKIDCESCHGAAREHVELARAGRLAERADVALPALAALSRDSSIATCFRCHATKTVLEPGYLPGATFERHYSLAFALLGQRDLYPDGRVRTFAYQQAHLYSECYRNGSMTCVDCHDPHAQSYRDVNRLRLASRFDDAQCVSCHLSKGNDPPAHTRHPAASPGSRCVACHMPYLQQPLLGHSVRYSRSDHTIPVPRPSLDEGRKVENACQQCHTDRTTAQLIADVGRLWGELRPQPAIYAAIAAADTMTDRIAAARLLLDSTARHPLAQFDAAGAFVSRFLSPDMATLEPAVIDQLRSLARSADLDLAALGLAALHLARGEDPAVRAFLASRLASFGERDALVRRRWILVLGFAGDQYTRARSYGRAIQCYRKVLELDPEGARPLRQLGIAYTEMGNVAGAIDILRRAVAADSSQASTHVALASALASDGDDASAIRELREALRLDPWDAATYARLGDALVRGGDLAGAAAAWRDAIARDPTLAVAHFNLARARIELGELPAALEAVRRGLEFAPDNTEGRRTLEYLEDALRRAPVARPRRDGARR